jgi:DNA-binding transcriptional MerR regulator
MKINDVESRVGITKKNIRFYEEQGLLSPRRNPENGYREYGEEEIQSLQRIKLLRKLGVPLEEIRQMLLGTHTVADGMRRHRITLEREQRNLEQSMAMCRELENLDLPVSSLDAPAMLARMEELEQGGTLFQNKQETDVRVRYVAPVVVTVATVLLMVALSLLLGWAWRTSPEDAPPAWFVWICIGFLAAVGGGTVLALIQRIGEIRKGEMDDAKRY